MLTIRKQKNCLQSFVPASWWGETWREGFFSGNGHVGINAFGGALNEKILINTSELAWQGKISVMPDVSAKIKEIRQLVDKNDIEQAQNLLPKVFFQKNFHPQSFYPLPLGLLNLNFISEKTPRAFTRLLNTSNGEISVSYLDGSTRITRNAFVSRADDLIVCEIEKTGQKLIDVDIAFSALDKINARTPTGVSITPEYVQSKASENFLYFSAKKDDGTDFGAVAKVTYYGGTIETKEEALRIRGANSVLIIIKTFANSFKEKEFPALKSTLSLNKLTYSKLLKNHQTIHQKDMDSVEIDMDSANTSDTLENLLLDARHNGVLSPVLAKKMWNYGRYLLYSSTSEDGKIVLPTGLFNGNYKSTENTVDFSGKTQNSYHSAFAGGMENLLQPLFLFAEQTIGDMRDNAVRLFNCRGLFLPSITAGNTSRVGSVDPTVLNFTGCAGYLAGLFYDYYLFTQDAKFLKTRALPFMKEVAQFYEEFFNPLPDGGYESNPAYSPLSSEKNAKNPIYILKNASIDFAIAIQLLTNLIEGSLAIGANEKEVPKWQKMLEQIPLVQLDEEGNLKDYSEKPANFRSAGTGAVYSAYASRIVDHFSSENIQKSFIASARKKLAESGNNQTAMTLIELARVFIRLRQKNQAIECLTNVINNCSYNNLALSYSDWRGNGIVGSDSWSPMQLSANMAFSSAIQEMLLYSKSGIISLLPCIPNDWKNIKVENLRSAGNVSVSFELSQKGILNLTIKAKKAVTFDLYLPDNVKKLKKSNLPLELQTEGITCVKGVNIPAGKSATFTFMYLF